MEKHPLKNYRVQSVSGTIFYGDFDRLEFARAAACGLNAVILVREEPAPQNIEIPTPTGLTFEMVQEASELIKEEQERRAALLKLKDAMLAGFGGITKTGTIVDRREHPDAAAIPANEMLRIPAPKSIP